MQLEKFNLSGVPTGKRILVFPDTPADRSAGGIWIPDEAKEVPLKGRIIQVGPQVTVCYPGEEVIFGKYAGTNIVFAALAEGKEKDIPCILMLESDLIYIWPTAEERNNVKDMANAYDKARKDMQKLEGDPDDENFASNTSSFKTKEEQDRYKGVD